MSARRNLKPYDGMSVDKSTISQRAEVLAKITDEPVPDCIEFGFYIGEFFQSPIPDYERNMVKNEINLETVRK